MPRSVDAAAEPGAIASSEAPYVEPVSPTTVSKFPHLFDFQGDIVIGASDLQVVVAGAFPTDTVSKPGAKKWQPALVAVFLRTGEAWHRSLALSSLELGHRLTSAKPVAVNFGIDDHESGSAFVTQILPRVGSPNGPSPEITWRLTPRLGRLALFFHDAPNSGGKARARDFHAQWQMHLNGKALTIGASDPSSYLIRIKDGDVAALIGFRPMVADNRGSELRSRPLGKKELAPAVEGYEFLLSRDAVAGVKSRAAALAQCLRDEQIVATTLNEPVSLPPSCGSVRPVAELRVRSEGGTRPIFIIDAKGHPVAFAAISPGATQVFSFPVNEVVNLADTPFGRLVEGGENLQLKVGEARDISLPGKQPGHLKLKLERESPAFVAITNLDIEDWPPVVNPPELAVTVRPGLWFVKRWPFETELPPGSYGISVAHGRDGVPCWQRVTIEEDRQTTLSCRERGSKAQTPEKEIAYRLVMPDTDLRIYMPGELGPLVGEVSKNIDADAWTTPLAGVPAGTKATLDATALPFLAVKDPANGLVLRFFPASLELARAWTAVQATRPRQPLLRFARFLSEEAAVGVLELGCPAQGLSLDEYVDLAVRLEPQAVQLWGCPNESSVEDARARSEGDLLSLWGQLAKRREYPPVLTPAADAARLAGRAISPLVVLPNSAQAQGQWTKDRMSVTKAFMRGAATLDAGAFAKIRQIRPVVKPTQGLEVTLQLATYAGVEARSLAFFSERGLLRRIELLPAIKDEGAKDQAATQMGPSSARSLTTSGAAPTANSQEAEIVEQVFRIPAGKADWLRVEVRGVSPALDLGRHTGLANDTFLGTSGFVPIHAKADVPGAVH